MLSTLNVYDQIRTTENLGGSLVADFDLPGGQIVYSGMVSHSTPEEIRYQDAMNAYGRYRQLYLDHNRSQSLLLNNSLRYEQQIGIVSLDASVSQVSIDREDDFRYRFRVAHGAVSPFYDSLLINSELQNWEPWQIYSTVNPEALEVGRGHTGTITPSSYGEKQWLADLNVAVPVRITDNINIDFKAGGKYRRKDRHYDASYMEYYNNNVAAVNASIAPWLISIGHDAEIVESNLYFEDIRDYDYEPNKGFMNNSEYYNMDYAISVDLMDEMWLNQVNLGEGTHMNAKASDVQSDYWGFETLMAGYVMGEINLGKRLVIIPGVRYERVHNEYTALKVEQGSMTSFFVRDTLTKPADHENWLPHVHVRFRATDWWDVRFSYNKTLTRPDYNYAIPSVYIQPGELECELGNPYIRPAVSENFDANFTFYAKKLGLITIGGFLKNISDVFYLQPTLLKNLPDTTLWEELPLDTYPGLMGGLTQFYVNSPYDAQLKGLEAEWQSNFNWLPGAWNGLVVNANYTRVWSETKYMQHRVDRVSIPVFPYSQLVENDTFYVNRLLHQPKDIANVSLGYDYKGFSARLSFRFQGNVIRSIGTSPDQNGYTNNIYKYDFVVKQKIPLKFADFEVFFNAINFTNVPDRRYSIYANKGETNTYTRYSGRHFQLGIRLRH
jgi:TonB-dependent receptor